MVKRKKEQEDSAELKKAILDYLQLNGWQIRQQYKLADAKLEEDPLRLVLVTTYTDIPEDAFKSIVQDGISIPVEIQKIDVKPIIVTGNINEGGKVEPERKDNRAFHNEISAQAAKVYNIAESIGPSVTEKNVKSKNKSEAYDAWKRRHLNVKVSDE
jgi:hypothetical protein